MRIRFGLPRWIKTLVLGTACARRQETLGASYEAGHGTLDDGVDDERYIARPKWIAGTLGAGSRKLGS